MHASYEIYLYIIQYKIIIISLNFFSVKPSWVKCEFELVTVHFRIVLLVINQFLYIHLSSLPSWDIFIYLFKFI